MSDWELLVERGFFLELCRPPLREAARLGPIFVVQGSSYIVQGLSYTM